ncbi:lactoylglutathione lyase [Neptunomonas marina]|uniref:lactoylglutathione lyase n=1 Tax=Neptunomonas marina TaxID=1815562 RepID=A0A437QCC4_9GAMM|nr:lactoylglutathione lyase [Neptunomonas marina]RVU32208.1 lactoylglutathione lyase [Neptunomonas marina]
MSTENPIKFRLDHTMIRVVDLEKSLDFYTRLMGMKVLRHNEYPGGRFTNVFIGYGPENETTTIELTHNWDQTEPYDKGKGYGHLAFNVASVVDAMAFLESEGVTIRSPAKQMNHGTRMLGFIEDPDGYVIELNEPINQPA